MNHFIVNLGISIWIFSCWYFAGLGVALVLLPKGFKRYSFLLAPIVGLCLLTVIGLFQITVVLTPLTPRISEGILIVISLLICLWFQRNTFKSAWKMFGNNRWFYFFPLLLVLTYAWLFHHHGLHILVGSSDPLQYGENARHIREVIHTGSPLDVPIARQDHFVYDMTTTTQPYLKTQRRGAELMLGTNTAFGSLSYQEMFPVTLLCSFLNLLLILAFLGKAFLKLSRSGVLLLQLTFFSSFYLLLMHIQGSLAMSMGFAPGLLTIALLCRIVQKHAWKWVILTVIALSAYISIYSEPALFNIIIPTALLLFIQLFQGRKVFFSALFKIIFIYCLSFLLAPYAVISVISTAIGNSVLVASSFLNHTTTPNAIVSANHQPFFASALPLWNLAGVVMGATSYYDSTSFNATLSSLIGKDPWLALIGYFILCILGSIGLLKTNKLFARILVIPLLLWMFSTLITSHVQDYLRFARSLHYSTPFMMIGLVLLIAGRDKLTPSFMWVGRIALMVFITFNVCTVYRTMHFVSSHYVSNDPVLLHFDERATEWQQLQRELYFSKLQNTPVLFSGFQETIRPLAIAIMLRSQPHVLGTSILNFWRVYDFSEPKLPDMNSYQTHEHQAETSEHAWWLRCNTRLTEKELLAVQEREGKPWYKVEPFLISRSAQAVIPIDGDYPIEWQDSKDVFAPRIKKFPNICEVIYRNNYVVTLPKEIVSSLQSDSNGIFRVIKKSGEVLVHDPIGTSKRLRLTYDGKMNDIQIRLGDKTAEENILKNGEIIVTLDVNADEKENIKLVLNHSVKLRSISWVDG